MNENDNIAHVMLRSIEEIADQQKPMQPEIKLEDQIKKYKIALLFLLDKIIEDKLNFKKSLSIHPVHHSPYLLRQFDQANNSLNASMSTLKDVQEFVKNAGDEYFIDHYDQPDDPSLILTTINTSLGKCEIVDHYYSQETVKKKENKNLSLLLEDLIAYFKNDVNNVVLSKIAFQCCETTGGFNHQDFPFDPNVVIKFLEENCQEIF